MDIKISWGQPAAVFRSMHRPIAVSRSRNSIKPTSRIHPCDACHGMSRACYKKVADADHETSMLRKSFAVLNRRRWFEKIVTSQRQTRLRRSDYRGTGILISCTTRLSNRLWHITGRNGEVERTSPNLVVRMLRTCRGRHRLGVMEFGLNAAGKT